ncbi:NAD(P)-binding protein [Lepidopterella palustris CBS 459.81]|uniref:NAD(P)-binding protein n=1 Tax=Lepidopterella palustris CBS 459.81 TaxID=1314670 RepID=A0A8E2JJ06_9PEZI|nr:NAD(P)-binding protein [Lepidopterella palustris CBS 459.81]
MTQSTPLPSTMRAWLYSANGNPSAALSLSTSHPTPSPPQGSDLLIRVCHCALNPVGAITVATIPSFMRRCPAIPELDFSGTVVAAGPTAPSQFPIGSRVCGTFTVAANRKGLGSLAEWIIVNEETAGLARVPPDMGMAEAAGLQCTGQTAVAMCEKARIKGGERVLVNGASGGVGTMVVQVAKAMGAGVVVAVCSEKNAELVRGLGADEIIDYRVHDPLTKYLAEKYAAEPFDVILDTIGVQELYEHSPDYLKENGIHINVGVNKGLKTFLRWGKNAWLPTAIGGVPRKYCMFNTVLNMRMAGVVADLVDERKLRTVIAEVFEMENALKAYDLLLSQRARGKVVVKVQEL